MPRFRNPRSDGFFCRLPAVNSWIPSAIHYIHLFLTLSLNGLFRETSRNNSKIRVLSRNGRFHAFCHVSLKHAINKQASPSPQATKSRTPYFLDPNLHLVCIHPAFLLCRNNDVVLVVDLRQSFFFLVPSPAHANTTVTRFFSFPVLRIFTVFSVADVNFSLVVYFAKVDKNHSQPSFCFLVYSMLMRM